MREMLAIARTAATVAGERLRMRFGETHEVTYKDGSQIVSEEDTRVEESIIAILERNFPGHAIFSEERKLIKKDSPYLWVIDPLDGTTNYVQGIPHFCVSIALSFSSRSLLGVVYDPMAQELFTAISGDGALLNGRELAVSTRKECDRAVIAFSRGSSQEAKRRAAAIFAACTDRVRSIRIPGATAADLCAVAAGRFDAMISNDCEFHDCAAGNLIASEAGALVSDFRGNPVSLTRSDLLVTNTFLQAFLLDVLREFSPHN